MGISRSKLSAVAVFPHPLPQRSQGFCPPKSRRRCRRPPWRPPHQWRSTCADRRLRGEGRWRDSGGAWKPISREKRAKVAERDETADVVSGTFGKHWWGHHRLCPLCASTPRNWGPSGLFEVFFGHNFVCDCGAIAGERDDSKGPHGREGNALPGTAGTGGRPGFRPGSADAGLPRPANKEPGESPEILSD